MIIGYAKSGTTSLQEYLREHPEIYMPGKEVNYFKDLRQDKNLMVFPKDKVNGIRCTNYLWSKTAYLNLKRLHPGIKVLICLRDYKLQVKSYKRMEGYLIEDKDYLDLFDLRLMDLWTSTFASYKVYNDMLKYRIHDIYRWLGVSATYNPDLRIYNKSSVLRSMRKKVLRRIKDIGRRYL